MPELDIAIRRSEAINRPVNSEVVAVAVLSIEIIQFGLVIHDIWIFQRSRGEYLVKLPVHIMVRDDGTPILDEDGQLTRSRYLDFADERAFMAFSTAVLKAWAARVGDLSHAAPLGTA